MRYASMIRVEVGRVFRSRVAWAVMVATVLSPLAGYQYYHPATTTTKVSQLLGNPALAGTFGATILFALLAVYEMSRVHAAHMDAIVDSIVSPIAIQVARFIGVLAVATITCVAVIVLYLPYTAIRLGVLFYLPDYLGCYVILMLMGAWLGCLLGAVAYQFTQRMDLSIAIIVGCVLLSLTEFSKKNYLLRFINPPVPVMTDYFSNRLPLVLSLYGRLFWLLILGGVWLFSLTCIRKHGKNLVASFIRNARHVYIPALAVLFLVTGVTAYAQQPFANHPPKKTIDSLLPKRSDKVHVQSVHVDANPDVRRGTLDAVATFSMRNEEPQAIPYHFDLSSGYQVRSFTIDGVETPFAYQSVGGSFDRQVTFSLPPGEDLEVKVVYGGFPKMPGSTDSAIHVADEVSPRYIFLNRSTFFPFTLESIQDSPPFTADMVLPEHMQPLLFWGDVKPIEQNADGSVRWRLTCDSTGISFVAGDYMSHSITVKDMTVELCFSKKYRAGMANSELSGSVREALAYCVDLMGLAPGIRDGKLKVIQLTGLKLGGGWGGNGVSAMAEQSYNEEMLNDPEKGANAQETLVHEIIHNWWGGGLAFDLYGMAGRYDPEWSAEGLTVYTTYRFMKDKYGEEYARTHYVDVWQENADILARDFYIRNPEYLDRLPASYVKEIQNANIGILTYHVMPLKIYKAEALIGGEAAMDEVMRELLQTRDLIAPPYLAYDDFLNACGLTREDLAL